MIFQTAKKQTREGVSKPTARERRAARARSLSEDVSSGADRAGRVSFETREVRRRRCLYNEEGLRNLTRRSSARNGRKRMKKRGQVMAWVRAINQESRARSVR